MADNLLDKLWFVNKTCAETTDVDKVIKALDSGVKYTKYASTATKFMEKEDVAKKLGIASKKLEEIRNLLGTGKKICDYVSALRTISDAIAVLDEWAIKPEENSEKAAEAFDKLFGAVGILAENVPFIKDYAQFFKQCAISKAFQGVSRALNPGLRQRDADMDRRSTEDARN